MLSPKRTKYRKMQRGRLKGKACRNNKLELKQLDEQFHVTQKEQESYGLKYFQINL
jgi:ribosomal protein L16/L10AE